MIFSTIVYIFEQHDLQTGSTFESKLNECKKFIIYKYSLLNKCSG